MNVLLNIDKKFLEQAQKQADKVHRLRKNYLELLLESAIGGKVTLFDVPANPAKQASLNAKKVLEKSKLKASGVKDINLFDSLATRSIVTKVANRKVKRVNAVKRKGGKNGK